METLFEKLMSNLTIMGAVWSLSAAATFGVAFVCKVMKWAPINVTVNVNRIDSEDHSR